MGQSGYGQAGASRSKKSFKGYNARSYSPSEDIDNNNFTLRQRARILAISAPLATSILKTYRTHTIGTGLIYNPRINGELLGLSAEETDRKQSAFQREFYAWANDKRACDATGVGDFNDMQQLAFLSYLTSGDCFAVKRYRDKPATRTQYKTCWSLIEADRVATPTSNQVADWRISTKGKAKNGNTIFDGVEVDNTGLIQAYYIANEFPTTPIMDTKLEFKRVEAFGEKSGLPNVLHIMNGERPDQYRGVSILAPVIEPILQARRYTDAELTAAIVEACFTAWVTKNNPADNPFDTATPDGAPASTNPDDYEMTPGRINVLKTGEAVTFGEPKRPAGGFASFMQFINTVVGAGVELPGDLILKQFNASFSASRAAFLEAQKSFKMQRSWFAADFCQPILEAFLSEAIALGRLDAPGFFESEEIRKIYCGSEWIGPAMNQINPLQEIGAIKQEVECGFKTRSQAAFELNGSDYNKNIAELKRENAALAEALGVSDEKQF